MEREVFVFHRNEHVNLFGDHLTKEERKRKKIHSFTCAVDLIEIDFLLSFTDTIINTIKRGDLLPITVGLALCHVDDCYSKKTGAKLATERMKPMQAQIVSFHIDTLNCNKWLLKMELLFPELGLSMKVAQDDTHRRPKVSFEW